ncbi:S8 family serine peptidase [Streptomyces sp. NPDC090025]|uniref:S8 family serine peptidase n=1 Tax=Streptomyces sp. NPDC090025 TaxID=3365922 RepID=UPI003837F422
MRTSTGTGTSASEMRRNGGRRSRGRGRVLASVGLGALLVGVAPGAAYADSIRAQQWHLDTFRADEIWRISKGEGVTVAVIDSGVDKNNPDLVGRVLDGKDLAPAASGDEHTDLDGHGTGMAGLIAGTGRARGGDGAFGLAPEAKILPIRLPEPDPGRSQKAGDEEFNRLTSEGIRYAADAGAKVINISQGVQTGSDHLTDAVRYALDKGSLVFASVGNSGDRANLPEYPGATPGVVGVGAIDQKLTRVANSQHGPQVDVVAPVASSGKSGGSGTTLWIALGAVAVVLVGGAVGFGVVRARQRRAADEQLRGYPADPPYGQDPYRSGPPVPPGPRG